MMQLPKLVGRTVCPIDHACTSVKTWLLALMVTVGHARWTPGQNPSSNSSLACVSKSCRDLPTRDFLIK